MIHEKQAESIVIGMPYNIDGSMSSHGKKVQIFAKKLENIINIPIIFHDERLSTSEARIGFAEAGIYGDIDAESARLIGEDFLENGI